MNGQCSTHTIKYYSAINAKSRFISTWITSQIIHNDRRHILSVQMIVCYFTYSISIQQLTSTSPYFVLVSLSYILFLHMFTYLLCKYVGMIWLSNNSLEGKKMQLISYRAFGHETHYLEVD